MVLAHASADYGFSGIFLVCHTYWYVPSRSDYIEISGMRAGGISVEGPHQHRWQDIQDSLHKPCRRVFHQAAVNAAMKTCAPLKMVCVHGLRYHAHARLTRGKVVSD